MAQYRLSRNSIDIIFKSEAARLVAVLPKYLGVQLAPIVAQLPTDSPRVDIHMEETDAIFELADGSLLHLEFQTTWRRRDLVRFLLYDVHLYARHRKRIHTVVIYGAGIEQTDTTLDVGAFQYGVSAVYWGREDGEARLAELHEELRTQGQLSESGQVALIFLPLMRQTRPMVEVVRDTVEMAQLLPEGEQRGVLAALLGLGARYLEQRDFEQLVEGLMSTVTGLQLLEQSYERGRVEGRQEGQIEASREDLLTVLESRFDSVPDDLRQRIQEVTEPGVLSHLLVVAATAPDIVAVQAQLP
jgi:hypothetical protein